MERVKDIFEKANVRGFADYLLYGLAPEKDTRSYEMRLEESFSEYDEIVSKYDNAPTSDLLDSTNAMAFEVASVYTEIGMQAGVLLMQDIIRNIGFDGCQSDDQIDYQEKYLRLFKAVVCAQELLQMSKDEKAREAYEMLKIGKSRIKAGDQDEKLEDAFYSHSGSTIEERMKKDKQYQERKQEIEKAVRKIDEIGLSHYQWQVVDEALSACNSRTAEYGRIAYIQGFKDAANTV